MNILKLTTNNQPLVVSQVAALLKHYNREILIDGAEIWEVKTGEDHPYRIKRNKKGEQLIEQSWNDMPRFSKDKWYVRKKSEELTDLYNYIIKAHNKACAWMGSNWKHITI